jgi:hypothetical protein
MGKKEIFEVPRLVGRTLRASEKLLAGCLDPLARQQGLWYPEKFGTWMRVSGGHSVFTTLF